MSTSLVIVGLLAAGPAFAKADCAVPMARWQPRDAVAAFAGENGWRVSRIRLDDGCYEVTGFDAKGRRIEVKLDPASLSILEMEYEDDDGGEGEDGEDHEGADD
ncbi:PepSY domain-containing protein [Gemmobacter aquarius]|uniref:PepSY domain-containing protein n=1 Tax=Paragemmobacter aquarius TaxID=2169400 RepID=A0A2S0URE2_9RHOB|nr:PepSY domain-containing protein [Gemmobacter aquarius]AWB50340.1 PepSY domain-containing protein [Gemmobacter aquarius]